MVYISFKKSIFSFLKYSECVTWKKKVWKSEFFSYLWNLIWTSGISLPLVGRYPTLKIKTDLINKQKILKQIFAWIINYFILLFIHHVIQKRNYFLKKLYSYAVCRSKFFVQTASFFKRFYVKQLFRSIQFSVENWHP